jgi:hypothetical protein
MRSYNDMYFKFVVNVKKLYLTLSLSTTFLMQLRAIWYIAMVATEDIDTQRRGIVLVFYKTGPNQKQNRRAGWRLPRLTFALPGRAVACHFCYDDKKFNPILSLVLLSLKRSLRARVKIHHGKSEETLMSVND